MSEETLSPEAANPPRRAYLRQAWLVLLLAALYGAALAGVHAGLSERIAENILRETLDQIPELVPGAVSGLDRSGDIDPELGIRVFEALDGDGDPNGWVVNLAGQGFADRIEILVGLDLAADTITGVYILAQKETPGVGNHIASPAFTSLLRGKPTDVELKAVRGEPEEPGEFDALTGATVSSEAVANIINAGLERVKPVLRALHSATEEP